MKTLRDEFALMIASKTQPIDASSFDGKLIMYDDWAKECYEAADAFMRARGGDDIPKAQSDAPWPPYQLHSGEDRGPEELPSAPLPPYNLPSCLRTWPAHDPETLVFTESDMLHVEEQAAECDTWLSKWKGVTPCRNCESMTLTPFGYKCPKCGGEDIPF